MLCKNWEARKGMKICVFGASGRELDRDYYEAAEELGALIAEHGHTLVFGGSRNGLMGAAAHGAAVCGGKVIGVMPREYDLPDVTFQGCTELIYTDTVAERKRIMQEQSDGFIILPGGLGTLDEFFDTFAQRQLDKLCKPIALLNTLDYYCALELVIENCAKKGFMGLNCLDMFVLCNQPVEALSYVVTAASTGGTITSLYERRK